MDLGIKGKTAIVCASSEGLGRACAEALAENGVHVFLNGRRREILEAAARDMSERHGAEVSFIAADATTEEGREAIRTACPAPDILVNNAAGPAPGDWRQPDRDQWQAAVDSNMLSAIFLIRAFADGMAERGFGRIVNITSALVKAPNQVISLSVAARLGLTGFSKGIAAGYIGRNVTINNLLPEQFETQRLRKNLAYIAEQKGVGLDEEIASQLAGAPAGRFGRPEEFGATCAFLCSTHAGYMSGQNILLDGARLPGLF